jgi:DNA-binding NarL/FixJ family response regulator
LQQSFPSVKVLFLTGHIIDRDPNETWQNEGYLEKPCTVRGLLNAVSALV